MTEETADGPAADAAAPASTPSEAFASWHTPRPVVLNVAGANELCDLLWRAGITDNARDCTGAVTVVTYEPGESGMWLAADGIEATHVLPAGSPAVAVVVEGGGA